MISKIRNLFGGQAPPTRISGPVEYIVAGLGNPGREYAATRHNSGYMALDRMAERHSFELKRLKFKSLCGEAMLGGKRVLFLKPSTYMNLSGQAVQEAMQFYKIQPEQLIVVCDDINLPQGKMRIRRGGSDGGQNGLKNIIYLLGSDQFPRVRIGIGGKAHPGMDLVDWVIGRFTTGEMELVGPVLEKAGEAVELIVRGNIDRAMDQFNR